VTIFVKHEQITGNISIAAMRAATYITYYSLLSVQNMIDVSITSGSNVS